MVELDGYVGQMLKKLDDLGIADNTIVFFSSQDTVERVKKLQKAYWADFFNGEIDQRYIDWAVHIGNLHAQRDIPNLIYFAAMLRFQLLFTEELMARAHHRIL